MTTLYGLTGCGTVKKARVWLAAHGVAYRFHDYRKDGVAPEMLARAMSVHGWQALVNRRGTTWRGLDEAARASVVDAQTAAAMLRAQPALIRRPLLIAGDAVVVGFDPVRYAALLG